MAGTRPTLDLGRSFWTVLLCVLLGAVIWTVARRPLQHDDLFFHLRTGESIAASGRIPHADSFTFTVPGTPWTTHEWGFGLLTYAVYAAGGYLGLVHLLQVLVLAIFGVTFVAMHGAVRPSRGALIAPLLLVGFFAGERTCVVLRAALCATLALAVLCALLQRLHRTHARREQIAICALFVIWANLHASVLFGLVVLGLHVAPWLRSRTREALGLSVACAALTLVNANGIGLWKFPFQLEHVLYHSGLTWQMGIFRSPTLSEYPMFYLLLALCLLACLPLSRVVLALRSTRQPVVGQGLSLLFLAAMALRSNRFVLDFALLALLFCASLWGGRLTDENEAAPVPAQARKHANLSYAGSAALLLALLFWLPAPSQALVDARFSPPAADFIQRERIHGRMFNPEGWGGYLGWRLRIPVYWDGRNDIFGALAKEFAYRADFADLVRSHRLDMLVLDDGYSQTLSPYLARERANWALVYFDDYLAVYLARTPEHRRSIERFTYTELQPFAVPTDAALQQIDQDPVRHARADVELAHLIAENPKASFAWYVRGALAQTRGDAKAAYDAFRHAARILPRAPTFYRVAQSAKDLGRQDEARIWLERALTKVDAP